MTTKVTNNTPQPHVSLGPNVIRSFIPVALIGRAATRVMETSVGQKVTNVCTKVRQFSKGLIGKAIGNGVKGAIVDTAGFVAGGKVAEGLLTQAGSLVPYAAPVAVAASAGAVAYKAKSKKARFLGAMLCLAAVGTTAYLALSSSDKREELGSHLQSMGVFVGIKAGQALGSFAAQRYLGATTARKQPLLDTLGNQKLDLAGNPLHETILEPLTFTEHAQGMGQYFLAQALIPGVFQGQSALRDAIVPSLAFNALPIVESARALEEGGKKGFQRNFLEKVASIIGDPEEFSANLARNLKLFSTVSKEERLAFFRSNLPKKLVAMIPAKLLQTCVRMLDTVLSQISSFSEATIQKIILAFLKDIERMVPVILNSLGDVAELLVNSEKVRAAGSNPELLEKAVAEDLKKLYPTLNLTDFTLKAALAPVANVLSNCVLNFQDELMGGSVRLYHENAPRILPIYLKYILMAMVTDYTGTLLRVEDRSFPITPERERDLLKNVPALLLGNAGLLPAPVADVAQKAASVMADVKYALRPEQAPAAAPLKGRVARISSAIGNVFKAAFRALCHLVGMIRSAASKAGEIVTSPFRHSVLPY